MSQMNHCKSVLNQIVKLGCQSQGKFWGNPRGDLDVPLVFLHLGVLENKPNHQVVRIRRSFLHRNTLQVVVRVRIRLIVITPKLHQRLVVL